MKPHDAWPWIAVVGGFLGAGKTTLIFAACRELERRGLRTAIILNDQGADLVDTSYAKLHGLIAGEVTGGCFCCHFSDLVRVVEDLKLFSPNVIFAEPVGSCTDISATVLHPLREYGPECRLAPFTVIVDPARAGTLLRVDADPHLKFLFREQIEEADLVCCTKSDLYPQYPDLPVRSIRQVSGTTGQGVSAWLDEILSGELAAGGEILDIDYRQYAAAEAALAWLNAETILESKTPLAPTMVLGPLLDTIDSQLTTASISIVHLKAMLQSSSGFLKAASCANGQEPVIEGALDASPALRHEVILNLRALGCPERVREIAEQALRSLNCKLVDLRLNCFSPEAPKPERRIAKPAH
jgi:Ni2+-binding GTPase involved in maturation of urease and hydrogenase